jgi:hypothetical protein
MNLNRSKKVAILLCAIIITFGAIGFFMPIIPERLPQNIWSADAYRRIDPRLKGAADKINQHVLSGGEFSSPAYNLVIELGSTSYRKSLFGTTRAGYATKETIAYGTFLPAALPFLDYNLADKTAQLTPDNAENFLSWLDSEGAVKILSKESTKKANMPEMATPRKPSD